MRSSRYRLSDVAGTTKRRRSDDCRHRPGGRATCRGDALAIVARERRSDVAPALPTLSRDRWSDVAPVLLTSSRDRQRDVAPGLPTCRSGMPLRWLWYLRCNLAQGNCRLNGPKATYFLATFHYTGVRSRGAGGLSFAPPCLWKRPHISVTDTCLLCSNSY